MPARICRGEVVWLEALAPPSGVCWMGRGVLGGWVCGGR